MGVSHTLSRHFFWSENILWKEDLRGHRTTVVLGGMDLIVDTATIKAYLTGEEKGNIGDKTDWKTNSGTKDMASIQTKKVKGSVKAKKGGWQVGKSKGEGLDVLWFPELDHAQVFDKKKTRRILENIIRGYCTAK